MKSALGAQSSGRKWAALKKGILVTPWFRTSLPGLEGTIVEPELRTVTWTEATIALPFLLAWSHCPTCMEDEVAVYMAVLR